MENQKQIKTWKLDNITFNKVQELKKFVDFVANLKRLTKKEKAKAEQIKYLIENIHNPETYKSWNACLNIFDPEIQNGIKNDGFYWRKWTVYFENESLEIEAETNHTADDLGHYGDDFCYYRTRHFGKNTKEERIYTEVDIKEFIKDAMNYKKYITASLNDLEIDIDIYEKNKSS